VATVRSGRRAIVVGAGIGGLTAARALHAAGFELLVVEQAGELREVGAGISLWPNAVNALHTLGLRQRVEARGAPADEAGLFTWQGTTLAAAHADQFQSRFGAPLLVLHRAELQTVLFATIDRDSLRLGTTCVAIEQLDERVAVHLDDGSVEQAELVVGADGIHSRVREDVFGATPIRYSGFTAWRGVVPLDPMLSERLAPGEFLGPGSLFGMARLNGNQAYWWASARMSNNDGSERSEEKAELVRRLGDWREPIPELIAATPDGSVIRTPLYERTPLPRLAAGRVAVVGDAAHPMLPSLGQGACQAIEDAAELGSALGRAGDVPAALAAYSRRRAKRTAVVVRASRQMARIAHLESPVAVAVRNGLMHMTPSSASRRRLAPIIGYEIE
jgi:2-polyprenyl-6-methoxyphenol hydroxylase-like FAD-dependent oxidoreductase